jgi:hypothetical protein
VGHNGIWLSRILIGVRPFHLYAILRISKRVDTAVSISGF